MQVEIKYSEYQKEFFKQVGSLFNYENKNKYILVNAVAGSGKTFSLIKSLDYIPKGKAIKFFAFNKSIASELKEKLPLTIDTSTIHSFGMTSIAGYIQRRAKLKVEELKSWSFIENYMTEIGRQWENNNQKFTYIFDMIKLINMWRVNLCDFDTLTTDEEKVRYLMSRYDVYPDGTYATNFIHIWNKIKKYNEKGLEGKLQNFKIDYVDMIYLPVQFPQIRVKQFDLVYVDECQDLSKCQLAFVERSIKTTGYGVYVGDSNQNIYSFAGADEQSYNTLKTREKTLELPLSVSYRCGQSIVEMAKMINPQIEPNPGNHLGNVIRKGGDVMTAQEGDFVLCRNLKPLITLWFHFIGRGDKCYIRGKDLSKNLLNLVSKVKHLPVEKGLESMMEDLYVLETALINQGEPNPKKNKRYTTLLEETSSIIAISKHFSHMKDVLDILDKIFTDDPVNGIQLMTIHKSKGLENDRVFIVRRDLIPSKYALQDYQLQQEQNLLYVAITRAKRELIFDTQWKE